MSDPGAIAVHPDVAGIVRPVAVAASGLTVTEGDSRLDGPMRQVAGSAQAIDASTDPVVAAVRTMYRRVGLDPTRRRPSSEALLRRVLRGDPLPRINSAVDAINTLSVETRLPFGLYDRDRIQGAITLRLGAPGEEYAGIRKDAVHVAGRLTLADTLGPFGNPTSDSARTMVTLATTSLLAVIFVPATLPPGMDAGVAALTAQRLEAFCGG